MQIAFNIFIVYLGVEFYCPTVAPATGKVRHKKLNHPMRSTDQKANLFMPPSPRQSQRFTPCPEEWPSKPQPPQDQETKLPAGREPAPNGGDNETGSKPRSSP